MEQLENISKIIAVVSVVILIFGSLQAAVKFFLNEISRFGGKYEAGSLTQIRIDLGQYLLLGLELLIASDVIETIVNPGLEELAQVGGVVIIRTLLSYFLNREIEAHRKHPE